MRGFVMPHAGGLITCEAYRILLGRLSRRVHPLGLRDGRRYAARAVRALRVRRRAGAAVRL